MYGLNVLVPLSVVKNNGNEIKYINRHEHIKHFKRISIKSNEHSSAEYTGNDLITLNKHPSIPGEYNNNAVVEMQK